MDLALYRDVLRRHRWIVAIGVVGTLALAIASFVNVSPSGISYRSPQIWSNEATLVLSHEAFPEGRSSVPKFAPQPEQRFASLVDLYSAMATSDAVVAELKAEGLLDEKDLADGKLPISATAVPAVVGGASPVMKISGTGTSPAEATTLTVRATEAFVAFIKARQTAADIPENDRIQLRVVKRSGEPTIAKPRSKTPLILILLAGLTLTTAAAFMRDNMQRRQREERTEPVPGLENSQRPPSGGLSLAPASGQRLGMTGVDSRLEALWERLRAEHIGIVHMRCRREGAERGIDAIACYTHLRENGGSASLTPSHDLESELDDVAFALLVSEVGAWRNGDGVDTLILDVAEKTATLHQGWVEMNERNGRIGSHQSVRSRST